MGRNDFRAEGNIDDAMNMLLRRLFNAVRGEELMKTREKEDDPVGREFIDGCRISAYVLIHSTYTVKREDVRDLVKRLLQSHMYSLTGLQTPRVPQTA